MSTDDVFDLGSLRIHCLHQARVLITDQQQVRLSPTEYRIVVALLHGQPVTDQELTQAVFAADDDFSTREVIEKHIDKIRRKLKREHLPFSIRRLPLNGYVLYLIQQGKRQKQAS